VWNLADKNNTDNQYIADLMVSMFEISMYSQIMTVYVENLAIIKGKEFWESTNSTNLVDWVTLCNEYKIICTSVSPYIYFDTFMNNPLWIDGSAVESLGFVYQYPTVTAELIYEQIQYLIDVHSIPDVFTLPTTAKSARNKI